MTTIVESAGDVLWCKGGGRRKLSRSTISISYYRALKQLVAVGRTDVAV
jgi:hypothetical protein